MSDAKDRKIEKLIQERDDWQRRAEHAEAENADLRRQLERQQVMTEVFTGGLPNRVNAALERLQMERDQWIAYALEINPFITDELIRQISPSRRLPSRSDLQAMSDSTGQPVYDWGKALQLAGVIYIKSEYNALPYELKIGAGAYPGTLEAFQNETAPALSALLGRTPTLADIGNKSIPGISADELLDISAVLTPHHDSTGQYAKHRLRLFDEYWPAIEAAASYKITRDGHYKARRYFKDLFREYLDAIFEARDKRLKAPIDRK